MCCMLDNITKDAVSLGPSGLAEPAGLWRSLIWGITQARLAPGCVCEMVLVDNGSYSLVVGLCCVWQLLSRSQSEAAPSGILLSSCLSPCLCFPQQWTVTWTGKPEKPFPSQVAFTHCFITAIGSTVPHISKVPGGISLLFVVVFCFIFFVFLIGELRVTLKVITW